MKEESGADREFSLQIAIEKFSTKRQHFLVLKSACKYNFLYLQAEMLLLF